MKLAMRFSRNRILADWAPITCGELPRSIFYHKQLPGSGSSALDSLNFRIGYNAGSLVKRVTARF